MRRVLQLVNKIPKIPPPEVPLSLFQRIFEPKKKGTTRKQIGSRKLWTWSGLTLLGGPRGYYYKYEWSPVITGGNKCYCPQRELSAPRDAKLILHKKKLRTIIIYGSMGGNPGEWALGKKTGIGPKEVY